MIGKARKLYNRIFFSALILFLLFNIIAINQAYHLTHFYERGTVKPVAEQVNGFWGRAQTALLGLKQQKLTGTVPDSAFTDIKLKTKDGLTLDAWLIRVAHAKGTIALFHGHGSEKSANLSQSNTFNEMGYSTMLVDFRAHGLSEGNTCTLGYREAEDVKLIYNYLKENGERNIILYGISLGAATITRAVAEYNLTPEKNNPGDAICIPAKYRGRKNEDGRAACRTHRRPVNFLGWCYQWFLGLCHAAQGVCKKNQVPRAPAMGSKR